MKFKNTKNSSPKCPPMATFTCTEKSQSGYDVSTGSGQTLQQTPKIPGSAQTMRNQVTEPIVAYLLSPYLSQTYFHNNLLFQAQNLVVNKLWRKLNMKQYRWQTMKKQSEFKPYQSIYLISFDPRVKIEILWALIKSHINRNRKNTNENPTL